ncbi:MAG: substrate-binding domain-containing protein [Gammaproteobacteria bacterium]|nr:substrate-binding domain-containing protein [Gammaproteobacteria bacterium]
MILYRQILFILLAVCFVPMAFAENVVIIVNEANKQSLTADDIKGIYSDNVIQWNNGSPIKSYDLPIKAAERELFSQKIIGTSARAVAKEWANRKITNTAKNPPKTKKEKLIIASVKKDPNAIGYVSESAIEGKSGITVVMTVK